MKTIYSRSVGWILLILSCFMIAPTVVSFIYEDYNSPLSKGEKWAFFISIASSAATGIIALLFSKEAIKGRITVLDGFLVAAINWIVLCVFAALPYMISGTIPNVVDALFESMSGLTTTGASIATDLNAMPRGVLFWRCMTQWLGGMGIIALFVAVLPAVGEGSHNLFQAEIPGGVNFEKLTPRIRETAKALWKSYAVLSVTQTALLWLAGMSLYDSLCHMFTTMSTGGFSTFNGSVGDINSLAARWIMIVFMILAGANFTLHYRAMKGDFTGYSQNPEFKMFLEIIGIAGCIITADLLLTGRMANPLDALTHGFFQVSTIMTTTGFATDDFAKWSQFSQALLVCLMFIGGCSGSTSGSIKVIRMMLAVKAVLSDLRAMANPREVVVAKMSGRPISEETARNTFIFMIIFVTIFVAGGLALTLFGVDMVTAFSASIACLGNIGPGLNNVGPMTNYSALPAPAKIVLTIEMMMGRLELFGVLIIVMAAMRSGKTARREGVARR